MSPQFSIPVIHPAFEILKRSSRILHFIAAAVIVLNAVHQLEMHPGNSMLCYSQIVIAVNILILVFFGAGVLNGSPLINAIFRAVEVFVLAGICWTLYLDGHAWLSFFHGLVTVAFGFLLYREYRVWRSEAVEISLTGIKVPDLLHDNELSWCDIKTFKPEYHSISIETFRNKKFSFRFRRNLKITELEQINEFCKQIK